MSACTHPTSALHVDRQRGVTHCTLCGDVVVDQQFELDPIFARGGGGGGGAGPGGLGGGGRTTSSALRNLGGNFRPTRAAPGMAMPSARPTIEAARRGMLAIARELEISEEMVEMALGIYKMALSMNAVSGARDAVLCACLYAVCRREKTPHVIYDFAAIHDESPHAILSQMKHICEVTHTEVPVVDISCLLHRFAEQMNLGAYMRDVIICALKVLRAMQDDWISHGRRPMGVCAAALLVACYVFGIPRTPEQVCGMVRLTANTIARRLNEFAATPTAALDDIDLYVPNHTTLPPAFNESSRRATEEDMNAGMRELSAMYYELVAEAKTSVPATPERCDKWRRFIAKHCELEGIVPSPENLDLTQLSAEMQLRVLGLPHTKPIPYESVEQSLKREEERLLIKREQSAASHPMADLGAAVTSLQAVSFTTTSATGPPLTHPRPSWLGDQPTAVAASDGTGRAEQAAPIDFDDPQQLRLLTERYTALLNNAEVRGLQEDFDFHRDSQGGGVAESSNGGGLATQLNLADGVATADRGGSPAPGTPSLLDDEEMRAVVDELLHDSERRHALPWQFLVLQKADLEDASDLLPYLVLDNEERLRREKVGQALYKELWTRGRARQSAAGGALDVLRPTKRRRRIIAEPVAVPNALERALRGRGAATVRASQISELIPGLVAEEADAEDEAIDEWD